LHPRKKPPSNEMEDGKGGLWPSGLMWFRSYWMKPLSLGADTLKYHQ
jgi:hypothetical protein